MIALAVLAAVVVIALVWWAVTFNRLVHSRSQVADGWAGIDVQLTRRADLVPVLVETVKGAAVGEAGDAWPTGRSGPTGSIGSCGSP